MMLLHIGWTDVKSECLDLLSNRRPYSRTFRTVISHDGIVMDERPWVMSGVEHYQVPGNILMIRMAPNARSI